MHILKKAELVQLISDISDILLPFAESCTSRTFFFVPNQILAEIQPFFLEKGLAKDIGDVFLFNNSESRIEARVCMGKIYSALLAYGKLSLSKFG